MNGKLTVEMLLEAKKLLDENDRQQVCIEYYPIQWKNPEHPYYEICVARVASGIGKWLQDETPQAKDGE